MRLEESVAISRPVDEVWSFYTNFFNAPRIRGGGMLGLRQTSSGPLGVGSTLQGRMVILGFETRLNYTITELDPPHMMAYSIVGRPLRWCRQRVTLEPTPDGTQMTRSTELELRPALKLIWPIIGPLTRRARRRAFHSLKGMVETASISEV